MRFSSRQAVDEGADEVMIANTAVYRDGSPLHVDVAPDDLEAIRKAVTAGKPGDFVSVGLHEPDAAEMERVAEICGQLALFMGSDDVVTVRQAEDRALETVRRTLEKHADVLEQGPAAVVYAVSDRVVDLYELVVSALENDVDDVETSVFSPKRTHNSQRISELNRELNTLRRAVNPLRTPIEQFAKAEIQGVSADAALFFRDVADHLSRVSDAIDSLDNVLSSVFDANLSRIGVQQNDDMRRMSAWAGIFAVVTVLAGIYGMNFADMPELRWSFGYPLLLFMMVALSVLLYRKFKRSGWL